MPMLHTAVLFIVFSRPETTRRVFESIRRARPARLYVAADGARADRPGEAERCALVRKIATEVDWDCEVRTLFQDRNLGCGLGPMTAISWFFEHETEGIIVEDDCLPSQSFFPFCSEILERYRDDTRVMSVAGNNLEAPADREEDYSYTFSSITYCWGWATWRRAWKLQDFEMTKYTEIDQKDYLTYRYDSHYERDYFQYAFSKMHTGDESLSRKTIWDYQWQFSCMVNSGLIVVPNRNLVTNLGFGEGATNTVNPTASGHDLPLEDIEFPLRHPEFVMINTVRDDRTFKLMHTSRKSRFRSDVKRVLPTPIVEGVIKPILHFL